MPSSFETRPELPSAPARLPAQDRDAAHGSAIVWFRQDLRLRDNPALSHSVALSGPDGARRLLCVYIHATGTAGQRLLGGAARWWLAGSLRALQADLKAAGNDLLVLDGDPAVLIPALANAAKACGVFWNRRYAKAETEIDAGIKAQLKADGFEVASFNGHLLNEPWTITTRSGGPMKVFTPYWRNVTALGPPSAPLPAPPSLPAPPDNLAGMLTRAGLNPVAIDSLGLEPTRPDWAGGLRAEWTRGEAGARARLADFVTGGMDGYAEGRNRPDLPSTSKLSPHLRFGEISVRQCWHAAVQAHESGESRASAADLETFLKELGWREFSYHLLHHNPDLARSNHNPRFDAFPWRGDGAGDLAAWQRGRTGYPVVDAGMRQLYATGWMHNRVRMIVGSFLVKHLLLDWRAGEDWFWDTLVDADPASNAASWQWVAGSGADAAPYFRIFNPIIQGEKFDPDGAYVRHWVPELARLPRSLIHKPWTAPPAILAAAGVRLGDSYPRPIVAHEQARERALAAFKAMPGPASAMSGDDPA
jgi:deoxyribodipyrimidine photo-lyase